MPDKFMRQYEILLAKAAADLSAACHLLRVQDSDLDMEIIFFHLQQSVEKHIKALLSFHEIHFEKLHDLERLLDMCSKNNIPLPEYAGEFVELNPYAVEGRYAVLVDDMHDADRFCERIKQFRKYCLEMIGTV